MPEKPQLSEALELFYSYSHKDEKLRDTLQEHLALLKRQGVIRHWHDRRIGAGREWAGEIDDHLKAADLILLLVSSSFIASDYSYDVELKLALERHEAGEACVIPIILRPCDWTSAPFGKLQALPKNARPVTKWPNRDDAFTDIANGIRRTVEELTAARQTDAGPPADTADGAATAGTPKTAASLIPRPPVVGFVARRDEQGRDIVGLLAEELAPEKNQLVALWGPGGAGKTTLAAEVVRATEDIFHSRVAWASSLQRSEFNLATLLDEIATQLGHPELRTLAPEPKAAQVAALIGSRPTLLVLDNFETIGEAEQGRCLDFLAQRAACPALITTRSHVNRDDVYNVPLAAMTRAEAHDFLQRLVERTRKPSNFDQLDRDDLISKCEANPLVLQWVVRQIDLAKRPQDVLNDLAQGEGDAAQRVFTRSFDLPQLGPDGRAALLALSLFTPSASREALARVAGFDDDLHRLNKAAESLSSLWLVETTEGNERLFLRGLTRELAKSRLAKETDADEFRRRGVAVFRSYAEAHSRPTPEDLDALEGEKDNLLGAIDMALRLRDWRSVMQIRYALDDFLQLRGYWDEAVKSGDQAAAAAREAKNDWNVAAFTASVATVRNERGEYEEAARIYGDALELFRRLGVEQNVAASLHQLGVIAQLRGDSEEAQRFYAESLEIKKRLGKESDIATTLHNLAALAQDRGDLEEARRLHAENLEINRRLGDQPGIAATLQELGRLALGRGELEEAGRLVKESLEIKKRLGDQSGIAFSLLALGIIAAKSNNKKEAAQLFNESLHIFEKLGSTYAEIARQNLAAVE